MFVFALVLLIFHNHQGFQRGDQQRRAARRAGTRSWPRCSCSLFVIYGFDTAATLAEETKDPRRAAPKAVLYAVIGAFIIGGVFLLGTLMAIPNLHAAITGNGGLGWNPANDHRGQLPVLAGHHLPAGGVGGHLRLLPVHPGRHHPAVLRHGPGQHAAVLQDLEQGVADAAHPGLRLHHHRAAGRGPVPQVLRVRASSPSRPPALIYLSYFLGNLVVMRARARGWPKVSAPFRLGRWGILVNVLGAAVRRRDAHQLRLAADRRATRSRTRPAGCSASASASLDSIPILWSVFAFIVVHRRRSTTWPWGGARSSRRWSRRQATMRRLVPGDGAAL